MLYNNTNKSEGKDMEVSTLHKSFIERFIAALFEARMLMIAYGIWGAIAVVKVISSITQGRTSYDPISVLLVGFFTVILGILVYAFIKDKREQKHEKSFTSLGLFFVIGLTYLGVIVLSWLYGENVCGGNMKCFGIPLFLVLNGFVLIPTLAVLGVIKFIVTIAQQDSK